MINWLKQIWTTYKKGKRFDELENLSQDYFQRWKSEYDRAETFEKMVHAFNAKNKEKELESHWHNKRKQVHWQHRARNNTLIDPRYFLSKDSTIPSLSHLKSNDKKALMALRMVKNEIKYVGENKEFWKFSYETWKDKKGDCEDGAILMYNIMLNSGIPSWRIRLNCGDVMGGGHAYITYLKESNNKWYVLDWCYWYNPNGTWWDRAYKYFSDSDGKKGFSIWGSLNQDYIYGDLPR